MSETKASPAKRVFTTVYKEWTIKIKRKTHTTRTRRKHINFYVSVFEPDGSGFDLTNPFADTTVAETEAKKTIDHLILKDAHSSEEIF